MKMKISKTVTYGDGKAQSQRRIIGRESHRGAVQAAGVVACNALKHNKGWKLPERGVVSP